MQYLVILAFFIEAYALVTYIRDMYRGHTKPNRVTWLGWTVAPMIGVAAALSSGAGWSVLPTFFTGLMPLVIFAFSFFIKGAAWKLSLFDYLCGVFAVLALVLWALTSNPALAVVFAILSDFSASLPTLIKAWKHPETELGSAFFLSALAMLTTFTLITSIEFTTVAFPAYVILVNTLIGILAVRKKSIFRKSIRQ